MKTGAAAALKADGESLLSQNRRSNSELCQPTVDGSSMPVGDTDGLGFTPLVFIPCRTNTKVQ